MKKALQNRELGRLSFTHVKNEILLNTQREMSSRQLEIQIWSSGKQSRLERCAWECLYRMVFKNRRLGDVTPGE